MASSTFSELSRYNLRSRCRRESCESQQSVSIWAPETTPISPVLEEPQYMDPYFEQPETEPLSEVLRPTQESTLHNDTHSQSQHQVHEDMSESLDVTIQETPTKGNKSLIHLKNITMLVTH